MCVKAGLRTNQPTSPVQAASINHNTAVSCASLWVVGGRAMGHRICTVPTGLPQATRFTALSPRELQGPTRPRNERGQRAYRVAHVGDRQPFDQ